MKNTQITTWDEIIELYKTLFCEFDSFGKLVIERVSTSPYARHLFASQSLSTLIVSTKQEWPDRILVAHMRVSPDSNNEVIIELFDAPINRGDAGICKTKIVCENENAYTNLEPLMKILTEQMNPLLEDK